MGHTTSTNRTADRAASRLRFARAVALVGVIALSSCARIEEAGRRVTGVEGDTFYASATVPLYAKPSKSSKVRGYLGLHEKVIRIQFDSGFALVAVGEHGLEGWVENSKLLRQLPASQPPAKPSANKPVSAPRAPAPAATEASEPAAAPAPEATPVPGVADVAPASQPAPEPGAAPAPAPKPKPAVYDPF